MDKIRQQIIKAAAKKEAIADELESKKSKLEETIRYKDNLREAQSILQVAAVKTQELIREDMEKIVTAALQTVPFKEDYEFNIDFVPRRNSTECDLSFNRGGNKMSPLDSSGYGAADVASFALRIAYWKLQGNLRPTIILDEPFLNLDVNRLPYAVTVLKRLAQEFGIQLIILSHKPEIIDAADKVIQISMRDEVSKVKEIKNGK
jgi:hypothetical protein